MREIRLTETELIKTIKKIISENDDYVTGISASEKAELIDDVINRLSEFGTQYKIELNRLNSKFNPQKVRRMPRPKSIEDLDLPKGLRISRTVFPKD
jgi:DNA-binding protein H-NS